MKPRVVKCVVWDLDGTLWDGVLAEGDPPVPRPHAAALMRELDARGVLQSIASRNDSAVLAVLEQLGLRELFVEPQLGSQAKSTALARIAAALGVALDAVVFFDDDPFERAEVAAAHPEVLCIDARELGSLLDRSDVVVPVGTGINRRLLYSAEQARSAAETLAGGPSPEFLASLQMSLVMRRAGDGDLARIQELMQRTNQLNTTGRFVAMDELRVSCRADDQLAVVMELRDRFGDYGTIGFALVDLAAAWTMRILMVSCRVQDRGVGSAVLAALMRGADRCGVLFRAEYIRTPRNRRMYVMLKLAGFSELGEASQATLLQADPLLRQPPAWWIQVHDETGALACGAAA